MKHSVEIGPTLVRLFHENKIKVSAKDLVQYF